jgi:putative glutamine transport system substrate-binding protein
VILPDAFAPQEYGVASKFANKDLAAQVDAIIKKWLADGTIKKLAARFKI